MRKHSVSDIDNEEDSRENGRKNVKYKKGNDGRFLAIPDDVIGVISSFGVQRELEQINRYFRGLLTSMPYAFPRKDIYFYDRGRNNLKKLVDVRCRTDVKSLTLTNPNLTDANVRSLSYFSSLKTLYIVSPPPYNYVPMNITGQDAFDQLPMTLEELYLNDTGDITDKSIADLQHLRNLKILKIKGSKLVTGVTFRQLPTSLTKLVLRDLSHFTDSNVGNLRHSTNLKILVLEGNESISGITFNQLPESLEELQLRNLAVDFGDAGIANLQHLINLKSLSVGGNDLMGNVQLTTGSTFDKLPKNLESLRLVGANHLVDTGIQGLCHLTNLKELRIEWNEQITGTTFNHLPTSLEILELIELRDLADAGMWALCHLTNLKRLIIEGSNLVQLSRLTDAGIGALCHLTNLNILSIKESELITGITFDLLPTSLKILRLFYMEVLTDAGIRNLQHLTKLKKISVKGCRFVTESAFVWLPETLAVLRY